jgi:hypothetical protein
MGQGLIELCLHAATASHGVPNKPVLRSMVICISDYHSMYLYAKHLLQCACDLVFLSHMYCCVPHEYLVAVHIPDSLLVLLALLVMMNHTPSASYLVRLGMHYQPLHAEGGGPGMGDVVF